MCVPVNSFMAPLKRFKAIAQGKPVAATYFGNPHLTRWVAETWATHHPRHAFVYGTPMAPYLDQCRFETRVIDMVEVASEKWRQIAETAYWPFNALYWRQERAMLALEQHVASRFDAALFASAAEAKLFARRAPRTLARVVTIRNGVDCDYFSPEREYTNPFPAGRKSVVFAGAMDYPPNVEGATWFATEVMTMLRHRFPTIDFWMIGADPTAPVRMVAHGDVHILRRAGDIRPYLAHADAVIAPLRVARGIENYVLEGMAMARPVIATPAALDGLEFTIGEEVLCSASAPGFASAVAVALSGRSAAMGPLARRAVEAKYSWRSALGTLDHLFAGDDRACASA